jgi:RHS repeat-associated protein
MKKLVFLVFLGLLPTYVAAQNTGTGLPPFGSLAPFGFDTINNQNLNAIFSIPLVYSAGRGMPLGLSLVYNSNLYQIVGGAWTSVTDSSGNPTWGWVKDMPQGGYVSWSSTHSTTKCGISWGPLNHYYNYVYFDALGTAHPTPINYYYICTGWSGTLKGYTSDNTGFYVDASTSHPYAKVTGPGGQQQSVNGISTAPDVNGNYVTRTVISSTETDWTDSIGNVALKVFYNTSANPPNLQYEFLDGNGNYDVITLILQSLSVKTNFACSGVTEYTGTATVPQELDIPTPAGGTLKYTFTYEQTPGLAGYYSGRLQRVTLPTGGYYEYDYPGANDSIQCSDGTTMSLNRVVSDGTNSATWSFVRSGSQTTVTVPKLADTPNSNDTLYTFNSNGAETQQKIYSESPGVNVLRTINTTWASNGTPATRITIREDGTTKSEVDTTIDSNGLLDSVTEYDWGSGAHGSTSPIRTTALTYETSTNYTSRNILNLITSRAIRDGGGTVMYRQDITHDGVALANCPTGVPQHDDTNYPCSMNYRGNATQVTTYLTPGTPANGIPKNFTYDVFGNLLTAQLNCCQNKTWGFSAATQYSQPDSVRSGTSPTQLTTSYQYNLYLGLVTRVTDPNNLATNLSYDFLRRTTQVLQANGSTNGDTISYGYDDTHFTTTVTAAIDSSRSVKEVSSVDGLGRAVTSTTEDVNTNVYSVVGVKYDQAGRAYSTSNPYTGSPSYWTTTQFDVFGRPISVTLPDNSATTYSYATNIVTTTDPAGKQRKSQADAAGRLSSVWEPDPTNNNSLTLQTSYANNVLDELTQVTQGSQTRSYLYDALGRLLSVTLPESGTTCFGTVTSGTCNANGYDNFDNLLYRTDARGVLTSYGYDGLNRLQSVSYNVGSTGVPATASVTLTYGSNASQFNNGLLITMTDGVGSENYSYNALEQLTQLQKVVSGTTYTTNYQYNLAGELTQITYPSSRVVQQSVDAIGRLCEIAPSTSGCGTASNPFATGYGYNVASEMIGFKYGNGIFASFGFSPDRLQLNCLDYSTTNRSGNCAHDSTTKFGLTYSYASAGSNNSQISGITDNSGTQEAGRSVTYTYDSLYRLTRAVTTGSTSYPAWGLSETYDRYGNRFAQSIYSGCSGITCPTNSVTPDPATNRISGDCYDNNGNLLAETAPPCPSPTYTYDAENRMVNYLTAAYTYDGNGLRVTKVAGSTTTVYVFSGSKVIAEYDNGAAPSSPSREYVYGGPALLAKIDSSGTKYYHQDHLSNRLITDSSGNIYAQMGHFPFGENWYNATNDKLLFTTYERDSESGNDYAMARYNISRLGRFSSRDPLTGSTSDPQSLNRYPYVRNDPIDFVDPSGRLLAPKNPSCAAVDCSSMGAGGGGGSDAWLFDALMLALDPSSDFSITSGATWNGEEWVPQDDPGAILGLQAPDLGPPSWAANLQNPFTGPQPQPAKPVDPIWDALSRLKDLLANDPDCLAFLGRAGINALDRLGTIMDGYYGQAGMLPTKKDGTWTVTNAVSFGYPGQLVTVNTVGAFFAGQVGNLINTTDRGRIPGGTPAAQGFILLHELGHNTDALLPDAHVQALVNANDKQLEQHCSKTINGFSR